MVGQAMGGHPFRQDLLFPEGELDWEPSHPTIHPSTEQSAVPDCQSCGACCAEAGAVPVRPEDDTPRGLTHSVRRRMGFASFEADDGLRCMKQEIGGRCVALRGEIGAAVRCSTYDRRPAVCREFAPGSEGCAAARERMAWKLSRMDWKPHGYGPEFALPSTTEGK